MKILQSMAVSVMGLALWTSSAGANITNTVPFTNTFEAYTNNTFLCGVDGWYGADETKVITDTNLFNSSTYNLDPPVTNATHTNFMKLDVMITNMVTGLQTNWVDMLVMPNYWDETYTPETNGVITAVYFNTNRHPCIAASRFTNSSKYVSEWFEITDASVETGMWVRVTIDINKLPALGAMWLKYRLDGVDLNHPLGHPAPGSTTLTPGPWFRALSGNPIKISSVSFQGSGYIDDYQVVTADPITGTRFTLSATDSNLNTVVIKPSRQQTVMQGSGGAFTFQEGIGYDITNVVVDGSIIGITNAFAFSDVQTNHYVLVLTKPEARKLVVVNSSGYGTPVPSVGTYDYFYGNSITCSISGSPIVLDGATTQHVCTGWIRTISSPGSGSDLNPAPFNIAGNTTGTSDYTYFTWNWVTQYKLTTKVTGGSGSVDIPTGFQSSGTLLTLTATTNLGATFVNWTGDTNGIPDTTTNVIQFTMDGTRSLTAVFSGGLTTNGTPYYWIEGKYPGATYESKDLEDTDSDGMKTWQEYLAGTDPNNSTSVFEVLSCGISNGNFYVTWLAGNDGPALPFGLYRSTNLLSGWGSLYTTVSRSSSGTNSFSEPVATGATYFYRPVATNFPP